MGILADTKTDYDNIEILFDEFPSGAKEWQAMWGVMDFFEIIGEGVYYGLLDKEMNLISLGAEAEDCWRKTKPLTMKARKTNPFLNLYFEWLALQHIKHTSTTGSKLLSDAAALRQDVQDHHPSLVFLH